MRLRGASKLPTASNVRITTIVVPVQYPVVPQSKSWEKGAICKKDLGHGLMHRTPTACLFVLQRDGEAFEDKGRTESTTIQT